VSMGAEGGEGAGATAEVVVRLADAHEWVLPPMLQHYCHVKERHSHALLLFRVGDFFEAYFDDAPTLALALGMTLTRKMLKPLRKGGKEKESVAVAMAGFPQANLEKHARTLLAHGHSVALCQQYVVDAKSKTVRRSLERVITPGTVFDEWLDSAHNFVAALLPASGSGAHGLVYADVTTGECWATVVESAAALADELVRVAPAEVLLPSRTGAPGEDDSLAPPRYVLPGQSESCADVPSWLPQGIRYLVLPAADFRTERAAEALSRHCDSASTYLNS